MFGSKGKLILEESKMTATLTLNELTVEQASAVLALLKETKDTEEITSEQAKNGVPLFDEDEEDKPSKEQDPKEETEAAADAKTFSIEEVRKAFTQYAKTNGKEAAKAVLEKFGAGKVTELDAKDYAAVMKEVS